MADVRGGLFVAGCRCKSKCFCGPKGPCRAERGARPGRVKTRLTPAYSPEEAAALARAALADTLA
ncbi:hypothetical protein AB0M28_40040, partial [Streptomyces sp. NPDC051940]